MSGIICTHPFANLHCISHELSVLTISEPHLAINIINGCPWILVGHCLIGNWGKLEKLKFFTKTCFSIIQVEIGEV